MEKQIIPTTPALMIQAGQAANVAASKAVFRDYQEPRAANTLKAQQGALYQFRVFLVGIGAPPVGDMYHDPAAWHGVTWGLVEAFKRSLLDEGYSVASINLSLSIVKVYAKLASKAGALDKVEYLQIKDVSGYAREDAKKVDEKRTTTRRPAVTATGKRQTVKKARHTSLTADDAKTLKSAHPDTPQGRRDAVLMCLLLDMGLRCGEAALIHVQHINLEAKTLKFHRPKVDKEQTHQLPRDLYQALKRYFDAGDAPAAGLLLRASNKSGKLTDAGMSERAITGRVQHLGAQNGISGLSAHDCRHYWATVNARKVDVFRLQEAGGWNSLAMPRYYVEEAKIANEGMESV